MHLFHYKAIGTYSKKYLDRFEVQGMPNDHYIPQCYLRNFEAEQGRIWCYENGRFPSLMGLRNDLATSNKDRFRAVARSAGIERLITKTPKKSRRPGNC